MLFSIIYSVDVPEGVELADYAPPDVEELWEETEGDTSYEYSYLEGEWENGSHRKWAAILDREQFEQFVERCELTADSTPTMGSLGAPGFGFGWAPAVAFEGTGHEAIQSAYVTPLPETRRDSCDERDWERVSKAVLAVFG
jgi:hypothetical protein